MRHLIFTATVCLSFGLSNADAQMIYLSCLAPPAKNSNSVAIDLDTRTVEMDGKIFPEYLTTISASSVIWEQKVEYVPSIFYQVSREDLSWSVCFDGSCDSGGCEVVEPPKRAF